MNDTTKPEINQLTPDEAILWNLSKQNLEQYFAFPIFTVDGDASNILLQIWQ